VAPVTYTPLIHACVQNGPCYGLSGRILDACTLQDFYFRVTETLQSQIRFCSGITMGNPEPDAMLWNGVLSIRGPAGG
jgi:hypothetical protein